MELHNFILQKILTNAIFRLAPAANMLETSRFPIGYMIWQHAVTLESICATNSIIIFVPVQRTGLLTLLLTCSSLLFSSLLLLGRLFSVQLLFCFCLFGQKYYKSKFCLFFALLGRKFKCNSNLAKRFEDNSDFCLSRRFCSILQKNSKTISISVLVANSLFESLASQIYKKRVPKTTR